MLVDQVAGGEAFEAEGTRQVVGFIVSDGVREDVPRARGGLEAASAPAAIEVQALHWGQAEDWAGVGANVNDATPHAVDLDAAKYWEELADGGGGVGDDLRVTTLGVAGVAIDASADDQVALVRLADVTVYRVRHDYRVQHWLDWFGDEGLQGVTFDG